jgi:hypothetical protein
MDIAETTRPKSDQLNNDDVVAAPLTVTVTEVRRGTDEQPIEVHLAEFPGRPFKPSKTVRRILVAAWGADGDSYKGRRLTLVSDPTVTWGGSAVGGIRVSHMSDLDKPLTLALTVTRGRRKPFTIQPLPPARDWLAELTTAGDNLDAVYALGIAAKQAGAPSDSLDAIRAQHARLKTEAGAA